MKNKKELTCFKAYDIRGEVDVSIDQQICYRIGRAIAQYFNAKSVVIGFDARETSPIFAHATSRGIRDFGSSVINIGLAGTEEMYWAVTEFDSCVGIEVTASHNPINYNGMKIVKHGSKPLEDDLDLQAIKKLAETQNWTTPDIKGVVIDKFQRARSAYVQKILSFIDVGALSSLRIVVNSGNGAAGPTFDAVASELSRRNSPLEFIRVHHKPDHRFPNGIPNPLLAENQQVTVDRVQKYKADFGIAFDGDFDRCFFFDETGAFVQGEYIVGLIASIFLEKEVGAKIVHDPRVIWNTRSVVEAAGGIPVQSKTGHAYMKKIMRLNKAIYGGEMSAHHYFRDFAYCDSGMITWLLIAEHISKSGRSLGDWIKERVKAYPSSSEKNFLVTDSDIAINRVLSKYSQAALSIDETDGFSLTFRDWRFNIRKSNTEPLIRLNVETKGNFEKLNKKVEIISAILKS